MRLSSGRQVIIPLPGATVNDDGFVYRLVKIMPGKKHPFVLRWEYQCAECGKACIQRKPMSFKGTTRIPTNRRCGIHKQPGKRAVPKQLILTKPPTKRELSKQRWANVAERQAALRAQRAAKAPI